MKKIIIGTAAVLAMILIGGVVWWAISQKETKIYVHSDEGVLMWLELSGGNHNIDGTLHHHQIIEEPGIEPFMEKKEYTLSGTKTENGFTLTAVYHDETRNFTGKLSGTDFVLTEREKNPLKFAAVSKQELEGFIKKLEEELEDAVYHAEEREKTRIRQFFAELRNVCGFLYTAPDGSKQYFIKIDEALLEGELTGSLLATVNTGNEQNPFKETTYPLNGITDGRLLNFYTNIDGKSKKLDGHFEDGVTGFHLSLWDSDEKLFFEAVTEEEYAQKSAAFKNGN